MPVKKKTRRMSREKVVRLIETFDGEVNNGGFDQFFRNSAGNETAEAIQALEIIGASKVAGITKRAAKRFPGGMPPKDRSAREDLLETISPDTEGFKDLNQEFYSCSEDLAGLLEKYMGW
jgi:hypothetical protein